MIANAWAGFDFGLGDDIDMLRSSWRASRRNASRRAPARSIAPTRFRGSMPELGALGCSGHGRGGLRGAASAIWRIALPWRKCRGPRPRSPVLWRAFQSLRQSDRPQRHRRAEA